MSDDARSEALLLLTFLRGMQVGLSFKESNPNWTSFSLREMCAVIMTDFQSKNNKSFEENKSLVNLSDQIVEELTSYIIDFYNRMNQSQKDNNA